MLCKIAGSLSITKTRRPAKLCAAMGLSCCTLGRLRVAVLKGTVTLKHEPRPTVERKLMRAPKIVAMRSTMAKPKPTPLRPLVWLLPN